MECSQTFTGGRISTGRGSRSVGVLVLRLLYCYMHINTALSIDHIDCDCAVFAAAVGSRVHKSSVFLAVITNDWPNVLIRLLERIDDYFTISTTDNWRLGV